MIYANCDMNPIQGERFQHLCETQISKIEHKEFESNSDSIDIDNFDEWNIAEACLQKLLTKGKLS